MTEVSVREAREQISRLLERVQSGEEVLILRRGKPAARLVGPAPGHVVFRSRASLRDELPAMQESASVAVRSLRDAERY
ncbi:type II toxin-antitoxin system Phd/YefM family antitoxin [Algiphilus aromaticivorans]|jgi:prevent-host-death family protein|uniref:type II toxin-antitoxin system Phd/YefM family antitoxin n=1 Tax=Algiphilus aromaticivorans TaxID=382454 RepID=UPI0005C2284F|nr:type II toxin-antitoxin system prevent-host-death family antitoxin [Algiphilus aromaticivorans]